MAVKYVGGGGGFWNNLLGIASLLIPGAGPYVAGANLLGSLLGGGVGAPMAGGAEGQPSPMLADQAPGESPWAKFGAMLPAWDMPGDSTPINLAAPIDGADKYDANRAMNQYVAMQNAFANTPEQQGINTKYNELLSMYGMTPPAKPPQTIEAYNAGFFQPISDPATMFDPNDWTSRQQMNRLLLKRR